MASADEFRKIALSFPGTEEAAHMDHPDFRVGGKIFATLGSPAFGWGMVKVLPEEQDALILLGDGAFKPAAGAWGRGGCTLVELDRAAADLLQMAIRMAWQKRAPAKLRSQYSG